jgi:hypothetical protein
MCTRLPRPHHTATQAGTWQHVSPQLAMEHATYFPLGSLLWYIVRCRLEMLLSCLTREQHGCGLTSLPGQLSAINGLVGVKQAADRLEYKEVVKYSFLPSVHPAIIPCCSFPPLFSVLSHCTHSPRLSTFARMSAALRLPPLRHPARCHNTFRPSQSYSLVPHQQEPNLS